MKYSDFLSMNESFQYAVNLQFDINDISKIKEYIPTTDACEIMEIYINSMINGKNRATTLIGPYGKGKSHLLLVLITLLNDYNSSDEKDITELINKIKKINNNLYGKILSIRKRNFKLLPVIINSNYENLNQAFLLALVEALSRENINDVVPNTYFDVAIKVIEKWEKDYKEAITEIKKCLKDYNCNLASLKEGLKSYSDKYYNIFKNVYSCILHGQEFNPLVNSDIVKTYKDISHEIQKYGYDGIFIAFDEFSKFLEYGDNPHMMRDLKILQDFAELANRTGSEEQIHLCCITHKGMNQYTNNVDENTSNAFKTVEGRFKEVYFNRSIEQNYEIISYAIGKNSQFNKYYDEFYKNNIDFYNKIKENTLFKGTDNIEKILFRGCFPLNPFAAYALIELSEKIAQNERTLFTFLTDDDKNSLKTFINTSTNNKFMNIDSLYDYFKPLLKRENTDNIKKAWIKSENALSKLKDDKERKIIKALAIIYMINEIDTFTPNDITIQYSLNLSNDEYNETIEKLIEKSIIKRRKITDEIDFANIYNHELSKEIKNISDAQINNLNIEGTLNKIITTNYSLPRRYNDQYKITRFFKNIIMDENKILSLTNFDILFEENYCDGIIINLIRTSRNIQPIRDNIEKINDKRVIVRVPKVIFTKQLKGLLCDYNSINNLMDSYRENEDNEIYNELTLMDNETIEAIQENTAQYFDDENIQEYLYINKQYKDVENISQFLSNICSDIYNKTPIVNNEMINKKDLSTPIKKAREIVLSAILNNDKTLIKSKTSAEATIYKAIVSKKGKVDSIDNVLELINKFISESDNDKISFKKIYDILESAPYSVRKGIIPIFIAMSLYNYSDIIVIYFMNKEIELSPEALIKINENPEKYYIHTEKGTKEKIEYLNEMLKIFDVPNDETQRINLRNLVIAMKKWILSLPRAVREYNSRENILDIPDKYIKIKNELIMPDINNNEFIYERLVELCQANNYKDVINDIENMKKTLNNIVDDYVILLSEKTKTIIYNDFKGSLYSLLKEWYKNNFKKMNQIYDLKIKELFEYIENLSTHDENEIINQLAKILTGYYIDDWNANEYNNYINSLNEIVKKIRNYEEKEADNNKLVLINGNNRLEKSILSFDKISTLGETMKSNIEEVMKEYGESVTEKEKVAILLDIVKKYL